MAFSELRQAESAPSSGAFIEKKPLFTALNKVFMGSENLGLFIRDSTDYQRYTVRLSRYTVEDPPEPRPST